MKRLPGPLLTLVAALGIASCAAPGVVPKPAPAPASPPVIKKAETPKPAPKPAASIKPGAVSRIPLGTFFALQQSGAVLTYDVRPLFHYSMGHIPGAINWPKNNFKAGLPAQEPRMRAALAASKPVVLYCTDLACPDARTVAGELSQLGYDTAILAGGWEAWKLGELPTE